MRQGRLLRANYLEVDNTGGTTRNAPLEVPCGGAWLFVAVPGLVTADATGVITAKPQQSSLNFSQLTGWEGWHRGIFLTEGNYNLEYSPGPAPPGSTQTIRWSLFTNAEDCHG